jgi:Putative prokaryotic signal transducing protein
MSDDSLVELQGFSLLHEAELAASALDASGIESTLREQFLSGAQPELVTALGGVALFVHARDLEAAREILLTDLSALRKAADPVAESAATCAGCGRDLPNAPFECPDCNSQPDRKVRTPKRTRWAIFHLKLGIIAATLLLIAAPAIWNYTLRRLGDLPEQVAPMLLYGVAGLVVVVILGKGLSAISDKRL